MLSIEEIYWIANNWRCAVLFGTNR